MIRKLQRDTTSSDRYHQCIDTDRTAVDTHTSVEESPTIRLKDQTNILVLALLFAGGNSYRDTLTYHIE